MPLPSIATPQTNPIPIGIPLASGIIAGSILQRQFWAILQSLEDVLDGDKV